MITAVCRSPLRQVSFAVDTYTHMDGLKWIRAISLWIRHVKSGKENRLTLQSYATISNMQYHRAYMRRNNFISTTVPTTPETPFFNGPQESKIRSSVSANRSASSTLGKKCDKPPHSSTIPLLSNLPKTSRLARRQKNTLVPTSEYDLTISNRTCVPEPSMLVTP